MNDPASPLDAFRIDGGLPDPLPADPMPLFRAWFDDAQAARHQPNPNAMTLATATPDGVPSARIVLCKEILREPEAVVFYTNYESRKGHELLANPRAAAVFHWDAFDRQARLEGRVERSPAAESDAYFASRAWEKRIGAWASRQSEALASRDELTERVLETILGLGLDAGALMHGEAVPIPRPPHWGGFRLIPSAIELWVGGPGRIHDRARWTRAADGRGGAWSATRLFP